MPLLVLAVGCSEPRETSCDEVVAHVVELRTADRAARAPERDREQHRAAHAAAIAPRLQDMCAGAGEAARRCAGEATSVAQLATCEGAIR